MNDDLKDGKKKPGNINQIISQERQKFINEQSKIWFNGARIALDNRNYPKAMSLIKSSFDIFEENHLEIPSSVKELYADICKYGIAYEYNLAKYELKNNNYVSALAHIGKINGLHKEIGLSKSSQFTDLEKEVCNFGMHYECDNAIKKLKQENALEALVILDSVEDLSRNVNSKLPDDFHRLKKIAKEMYVDQLVNIYYEAENNNVSSEQIYDELIAHLNDSLNKPISLRNPKGKTCIQNGDFFEGSEVKATVDAIEKYAKENGLNTKELDKLKEKIRSRIN